jgi:hypothetical protein
MVICSERNNEAGYTVLILVFSLLLVVPQAFGEDPNIGKSVDIIYFEGDVVSTNFQIWSAGT